MELTQATISKDDLSKVIRALNHESNRYYKEIGYTEVSLEREMDDITIVPMIFINGEWRTTLKIE